MRAAVAAGAAGLLLAGCAANQLTQVGVVRDYARLAPEGEDGRARSHAGAAAAGRIELMPPQWLAGTPRSQGIEEADRSALLAQWQGLLAAAAARRPAAEGRPLRLYSAITDVDRASPMLNAATTLLVGPMSGGGASVELSLRDAASGEEVAALVCAEQARPMTTWAGFTGAFSALGHTRAALGECAARFERLLLRVGGAGAGS